MATVEEIFRAESKFLNLDKYHEQGFTGKGITVLNMESFPGSDGHGEMTTGTLKDFAPDCIVINSPVYGRTSGDKVLECYLYIDGVKYDFEEAIKKFKIKVTTASTSGSTSTALLNYFKELQIKYGFIMFNSAGNEGTDGVTGKYSKNDTAVSVGSVFLKDGKVVNTYYSGRGAELDFVMLEGRGRGTSASCPNLAGETACLLQRFGDFTQAQAVEILKIISMELGEPGDDDVFGYGLPILPMEPEKIQAIENLLRGGAETMPDETATRFVDVPIDHVHKKGIEYCFENGIMLGDGQGYFRPDDKVTRAELATVLERILNK